MKTKLKTPNDGARAACTAILRYLRRLNQRDQDWLDAAEVIRWIKTFSRRASKRRGGLGRK